MTDVHQRLVREIAGRLADADVPSPDVDAARLVAHVREVAGDPGTVGRGLLAALVDRRVGREPLQLVMGRTWFRLLELLCEPGVFVPRPETEVVAGVAVELARRDHAPLVLEPCTGGGAIALSVAAEVAGVRVVAGDVDPAAVALARRNATRVAAGDGGVAGFAPGASVEVVDSDLLAGFGAGLVGAAHVVVANPPYLPASDRSTWPPEVADHDPERSLVGGPGGHEVVDALLAAAPRWLRPGGTVVVEIDPRRAQDAVGAASRAALADVRLVADLTGADRALVARRPE